jgi:hypothetical protein
MGSITDFLEGELLDHVFNAAYTRSATHFVALCTADPTDAALGNNMSEVPNAFAYQRTTITFGVAASRVTTQSGAVSFPQASGGSWGTVTHWAICTSQTYDAGDVLATGAFAASKTINDGNTASIPTTEINVTISAGEVSNYLANKLLDFAFRNQVFAAPATWIALCEAVVADDDTGTTITEEGAGSYGRVQVNVNGGSSPTWDLKSGTTPTFVDNTHAITFTQATGDWGSQVAVAICDAETLGNLLLYDNDMSDQTVNNGDTAEFAIGELDIQLT